jgi:hypothetical protein
MLARGIREAAGSFEEMEYYEKRAIAAAAGLEDVGQLAMLMSGRLEQMSNAQAQAGITADQLADQQMAMMSLSQSWNAALAQLAPSLEIIMRHLVDLVQWVARNAET